jgi:glyceraldehyde-3-phosphate dehydrogenase (NADP+)
MLLRAGWPKSALSVLPSSSAIAAPLVEDDRFKLITFTGSAEVGWAIKERAGKKRVALELGGNAAAVIDEGADLSYAASRCASGGFAYAGQSCISVQRILVHWEVKKDFLRMFMDEVARLKTGDIMDPEVLVGPLITEDEAIRVERWVSEAKEGGAHILTGGTRNGAFFAPTVITQVDPAMKVSCQEVFGPVVVVDSFGTWDEALEKVNDSDFGLQAGIFTSDIDKVMKAFEEIEVGGLVVNDIPTYRIDPQPYGGSKDSGTGREGPHYAIEEMTELRVMLLRRR